MLNDEWRPYPAGLPDVEILSGVSSTADIAFREISENLCRRYGKEALEPLPEPARQQVQFLVFIDGEARIRCLHLLFPL